MESNQVSLCSHRHEDGVVSHPDLLSFGALLGRGVNGPPARLAYKHKKIFSVKLINYSDQFTTFRLFLQSDVKGQFVGAGAAREAGKVLK